MGRARNAAVIGGGIAGPVAAAALQRAGIDAVVYEAYDRGADNAGAFLSLGVNGIAALRAVEMDTAVLAYGFATPRTVISNGKGKVLASFPNGGALDDGTRAITIKRPDLYRALREEAVARGIRFEYGKRLVDVDKVGAGVRARFSDGSSVDADVLVGADGIHSRTRALLDPAAPGPTYVGFLNTGGYVRGVDVAAEPGVNHFVFGRNAFFGYVKHPDGQVWWFANPPRRREPRAGELEAIGAQQWRAYLLRLFAPDAVPAIELISATERIFAGWITYDLPRVPVWRDDRMVVIGDAAHALSPSAGQGASMAIEDAVLLALCLRDSADVAAALERYEQIRRPRVERVVAQGRRNGSGKQAGPLGRAVRDLLLPQMMRWSFRGGRDPFEWVWNHMIDWDAGVAETSPAVPEPATVG